MTNMEFFMVIISIVSPLAVGLFVWSGVKAQIKANESNISKQVKEELEKEQKLLDEKSKKDRQDRWWNLKFDLFLEVYSSYTDSALMTIPGDDKKIEAYCISLGLLCIRCDAIFDDQEIWRRLHKIDIEITSDNDAGKIERLFMKTFNNILMELKLK